MIHVKSFVFNPFQVNTYVLYDESKECVIIDAGCFNTFEQKDISNFIKSEQLKPLKLLNTHCHIDHILGNAFLKDTFKIGIEIHKKGLLFIESAVKSAATFGIQVDNVGEPTAFFNEGDIIQFGNSNLEIIYTPGHADGSVCFVNKDQKFVIVGDVLFNGGIGRTDLPTGDFDLLIDSIKNKLLILDDDFTVYSGHGPETTIGIERENNYYLT